MPKNVPKNVPKKVRKKVDGQFAPFPPTEPLTMYISDWLSKTTVSDIMVRKVTSLQHNQSLAHAAGKLLSEQISGAPVMDDRGFCVGVLSVIDVIKAEDKVAAAREQEAESSFWHSNLTLPASVYESRLAEVRDRIAPAAEQPVERFMTSDIVSVEGKTSVRHVVDKMINAHIHRVVVLDPQRRLQGVASTMDILAALLRAGSQSTSA